MSVFSGQVILPFFHLLIHAIFKSGMFILSGFIMQNSGGSQNLIDKGAGESSFVFFSSIFFFYILISVSLPYFMTFFSKDKILFHFFSVDWWECQNLGV